MSFENHGGPCKTGCERIACMCAHEKLAREYKKALALVELARKWLAAYDENRIDPADQWPLCHQCCLALGAKPSPWPVTVSEAKCTRCGKVSGVGSYTDYTWPSGDKAVWD